MMCQKYLHIQHGKNFNVPYVPYKPKILVYPTYRTALSDENFYVHDVLKIFAYPTCLPCLKFCRAFRALHAKIFYMTESSSFDIGRIQRKWP